MGRDKTRRLALTAVFSAFSVVFLYMASVFPTGQLGFLGVASLFGVAAVCEYGIPGGVFVFAVTALLGFLIVPEKVHVLLYVAFFGWYPMMKSLAEQRKSRVLEWAVKLVLFNLALTAALFLVRVVLFDALTGKMYYAAAYLAGNVVFVLFDIGVSRVIAGYMATVFPKIHTK